MSSQCEWIDTITDQSRTKEVDSVRRIVKDPEVGVLHIFGDKGIGKRTLVQCLARGLLSGESDFARVFMIDLLSEPLALEEWNVENCDWMAYIDLPSRSLMGVLQVLFGASMGRDGDSHADDLTNGSQTTNYAENRAKNSDVQQNDDLIVGTHLRIDSETELHVTAQSADSMANSNEPRDDAKDASEKRLRRKRVLVVLKDYSAPDLPKRTIEEEAVSVIQSLMKQKRLVLILLSEANLLDRSHNESQRLETYRRLFQTTKGWQFKVGLLSDETETKSAIALSFQRREAYGEPMPSPTDDQVNAILQAAGPHPRQIDQAVANLASYPGGTPLVQYLADVLLHANKAVYEATWNSLQQREKSVLLTYGLIKRDKLNRMDAQAKLDRQTENFSATDTDFIDVEKKRNDPWSRVGQCLLPWNTEVRYQFFCEAFASFVEGKLPPELSFESIPNWRAYVRTPMFLFLMFFASIAVGLVMLLLTMAFNLPRLLAVCIPLLPVFVFFTFFLISHVPLSRR